MQNIQCGYIQKFRPPRCERQNFSKHVHYLSRVVASYNASTKKPTSFFWAQDGAKQFEEVSDLKRSMNSSPSNPSQAGRRTPSPELHSVSRKTCVSEHAQVGVCMHMCIRVGSSSPLCWARYVCVANHTSFLAQILISIDVFLVMFLFMFMYKYMGTLSDTHTYESQLIHAMLGFQSPEKSAASPISSRSNSRSITPQERS